jgi:hypothetical protein
MTDRRDKKGFRHLGPVLLLVVVGLACSPATPVPTAPTPTPTSTAVWVASGIGDGQTSLYLTEGTYQCEASAQSLYPPYDFAVRIKDEERGEAFCLDVEDIRQKEYVVTELITVSYSERLKMASSRTYKDFSGREQTRPSVLTPGVQTLKVLLDEGMWTVRLYRVSD